MNVPPAKKTQTKVPTPAMLVPIAMRCSNPIRAVQIAQDVKLVRSRMLAVLNVPNVMLVKQQLESMVLVHRVMLVNTVRAA